MNQNSTVDLLSLLYELSLTTLKGITPEETASRFIKKLISRKSLQGGGVWIRKAETKTELFFTPVYSIPFKTSRSISKSLYNELFKDGDLSIRTEGIFEENAEKGSYGYYKLGDFGILKFYRNVPLDDTFSVASFSPFLDVFDQLKVSLEGALSTIQLEEEILQRKSAERSLKANEDKYRRIIDNISLGLLEVDNDELITHANKPFLALTGYTLKEIAGKKASDLLLDSEEAKDQVTHQTKLRSKGDSSAYEVPIRDKDGNRKWAIISGAPNYDNKGELIGSIGIHLDVTQEKKLREDNQFKTEQLKKLFEMSLDALISVNSKGEIFEWSSQAEQIFGYQSAEIMGKRLSDTIIPHQHREAHSSGMRNYMKTGHGPVLNTRIEIIGLRKSGEVFPIELTIFPLTHNEEKYFTAFVRDISELKEAENNMQKALKRQKELNKMKSQFISMTSHELRTPLTTIRSNTELLNYQVTNADALKPHILQKNIKRIDNNVDRLNQLINNILLIGKLDSDKVPFKPKMTNVYAFIENKVLADFRDQSKEVLLAGSRDLELALDSGLFTHIMNNLVENALKYSADSGKPPTVFISETPEMIQIAVKDEGIGIPKSDQNKLFETFFRASNVDNIQGTGLGLSIVKQFVEIHGGNIAVSSEVGKGTIFHLTFKKN